MIFNSAIKELKYENNENQQTEVSNDDMDNEVNVKQPSKASRNFAKPVFHKDITKATPKLFQ